MTCPPRAPLFGAGLPPLNSRRHPGPPPPPPDTAPCRATSWDTQFLPAARSAKRDGTRGARNYGPQAAPRRRRLRTGPSPDAPRGFPPPRRFDLGMAAAYGGARALSPSPPLCLPASARLLPGGPAARLAVSGPALRSTPPRTGGSANQPTEEQQRFLLQKRLFEAGFPDRGSG